MADPRYAIPGPVVPDLSPGLGMLAQALQNARAGKRADEYLRMERDAVKQRAERESAAAKRQQAEDERRHAIEDFAARPALRRMAFQEGAAAANANPYNVQFSETHDLPANVEGPEMSPAAEEARFSPKPPQEPEFHVPEQPPVGALHASEEGPELNPAASAARYMLNGPQAAPRVLDLGEEGPQQEQPQPLPIMAQAAANSNGIDLTPGPEGQRRMFESVGGGQPHELHQRTGSLGLGPEWDRMYNSLIEGGAEDLEARKYVLGEHKAAQNQDAIAKRTADQIAASNARQTSQQAFTAGENTKYRSEGLTFEQRKELANIMAHARMAASGAAPINPGVARLVGMKEAGATDEEIYAEASKLKLSQKDVAAPVQNVVKNAAAGERAGQKREQLAATGPGTSPGDTWKNPQAAAKGQQQIQRFHRVEVRLKELIDDVKRTGNRVLSPDEQVQRMSKAEAAAAALRPYNELSSTDASMEAERAILGPTGAIGHGWVLGANLETLERLLHEAQDQQHVNLQTLLRPGGGSQLAPALGGHKGGSAASAGHPSQAEVGETRKVGDVTYQKVGPNNWQPVQQ